MNGKKSIWVGIFSGLGMLVIILDTKTALTGAHDGISLCLTSVIPALFPFFVLSSMINNVLTGLPLPFLRSIGKLCGIPKGAESLLLLGLMGGYPVGAQAVAEAYRSNKISKRTAERLLGFCSNAGPSFIFGILSSLFSSLKTVLWLWLIHILSALITGFLLPGKENTACTGINTRQTNFSQIIIQSIRVLATVCGWVVLFRILLAFFQRWFLWLLPAAGQCLLMGSLELTNGCCQLDAVSGESTRFLLCCCILTAGGLCVLLQTVGVTGRLGLGLYIPGKLLQTAISLLLASVAQIFLYPAEAVVSLPLFVIPVLVICAVLFGLRAKKSSSIMKKSVV